MKYCVYCGCKNHKKDKKCFSCGKDLNAKDHLVKEYLIDHLIDDGSGKVLDTIGDFVKAFVKKYLYGIFLTVSVVTTTTSLIVHQMHKDQTTYQEVLSTPSFSNAYVGAGLDGNAVANRYALLLQENDVVASQAYQLDWYYPDLFETEHDLYEQRDIYFKGYDENTTLRDYTGKRVMSLVESFKPVYTDTCHNYEALGYHCDGATFEITYAYPNTFIAEKKLVDTIGSFAYQQSGMPRIDNGYYFYTLLLAVYTIQVDGNYYVVGDQALPSNEEIYHDFMEAKGDITKIPLLKEYQE